MAKFAAALLIALVAFPVLMARAQTTQPASEQSDEQSEQVSEEDRRRGRLLTRQFLEGRVGALATEMSASVLKERGGFKGLGEWARGARENMGGSEATSEAADTPESIADERLYRTSGETYYCQVRRVPDQSKRAVVRWRWLNDEAGDGRQTVTEAHASAVPDSLLPKRSDYETQAELHLPFRSGVEMYTSWGGRHACDNYHVSLSYGNAFAYDFKIRKDGRSYEGDGTENEDYYCYGTDLLAPASGRVVAALDTVAENPTPGEYAAGGGLPNYVVINHGNEEYSMFAHVREGSVPAETGETVERGEKIGECGNNGTSTEPHIHYQLQSEGRPTRDTRGLPAPFTDYHTRDGGYIEQGEPKRGQYVRNE